MARRGSAAWYMAHYGPPTMNGVKKVEIANGVRLPVKAVAEEAFRALGQVFQAFGYHVRADDSWGIAIRKIRGSSAWSTHAFGLAVDINASTNPMGARLVTDMPPAMIDVIRRIRTKKSGLPLFRWGGDYRGRKDAMHFELIVTKEELAEGFTVPTMNRAHIMPPEGGERMRKRMLKRGDKGQDVEQLQRLVNGVLARSARLGAEEIPPVKLDGDFGPATEAALAHAIPRSFHYAKFNAEGGWKPSEVSMTLVSCMMVAVSKMAAMLESNGV